MIAKLKLLMSFSLFEKIENTLQKIIKEETNAAEIKIERLTRIKKSFLFFLINSLKKSSL